MRSKAWLKKTILEGEVNRSLENCHEFVKTYTTYTTAQKRFFKNLATIDAPVENRGSLYE